jgi:two-component system, chemotaxis family, CheB/CheR fusion protein
VVLVKRNTLSLSRAEPPRASPDDLAGANEELRLLNEELLAAQAELEATNDELKRVNEQLARRNQEFSRANGDLLNLIAAVDIPMVILDIERRIRRFTPRARLMMNVKTSDLGRPLDSVRLHIVGAPDLDAQITEVTEGLVVREQEVRDREGRWHRLQIRPYQTPDNRVDGVILSLVDIDALRRSVADAVAARTDAEQANGAKDQFLATLSHELRTPLTSILVNAQLLLEKEPDVPQRRRAYEAIARGARTQKQLIDDLLDVSGIVSGKTRMDVRTVDLLLVATAALEQARIAAERKGLVLESDLQPVGMMAGDPGRLEQVVANLLNNAIKFTPEGGRVRLELSAEGSQARLTVTDTGIGIEPAFLSQVFERFSQADSSPTRAHGGLGLGLTITRHLVQMHGGTVQAHSAGPGRGSAFSVWLPRLMVPAEVLEVGTTLPFGSSREEPGGRRLEPDARQMRILIVDDDRDTREAVAEMLEQSGAAVCMAESAAGALEAFAEFAPTLVVSDIAMPGEDGCSLMRKIRALGPLAGGEVPAIALTALAREDDRARALAAGFQSFVAKPVSLNNLRQVVLGLGGPGAQENSR